MYLLDTNTCVYFLNNRSAPLVARLRQQHPTAILLCSIVKAELVYGAYRSARTAANLRHLEAFFEPYVSLPFDDRCVEFYGRLRSELERLGTPIGPNDLMIAATALAHELTLVTSNVREFSRVVGLRLENWEEG